MCAEKEGRPISCGTWIRLLDLFVVLFELFLMIGEIVLDFGDLETISKRTPGFKNDAMWRKIRER